MRTRALLNCSFELYPTVGRTSVTLASLSELFLSWLYTVTTMSTCQKQSCDSLTLHWRCSV